MKKKLTDFEKEITATTQKIQSLNRQKANVAVDVAKAKQELKEARKAFDDTDESAKRLAEAEYNYANLTSELKSVTSEANSASRALNSLRDQQAKAENRAGGSSAPSGGIRPEPGAALPALLPAGFCRPSGCRCDRFCRGTSSPTWSGPISVRPFE